MDSADSVECDECGSPIGGDEQYLCMGCSRILCVACFGEHDRLCHECLDASEESED
jgi:hypothetical protein